MSLNTVQFISLNTAENHVRRPQMSDNNDKKTTAGPLSFSSKYRHVAAVHSRIRNSCLSHDSNITPSFLGFRNLMVLVLSELSPRDWKASSDT